MGFQVPIFTAKGYGRNTQNAGTKIVQLVEPVRNAFTRLTSLWYTAGATDHILTVMRPLGKTTLTAAAAASQAVINVAADPGDYSGVRTADNAIAANDYVVLELADGTFLVDTVSSVSSLAITLSNNLPTLGALEGATVWFFGIETDTNPGNAQAHPRYNLPASVNTYLGTDAGQGIAGFVGTFDGVGTTLNGRYEPIVLVIDNGTNAGKLQSVTAVYTDR